MMMRLTEAKKILLQKVHTQKPHQQMKDVCIRVSVRRLITIINIGKPTTLIKLIGNILCPDLILVLSSSATTTTVLHTEVLANEISLKKFYEESNQLTTLCPFIFTENRPWSLYFV